MKNSSYDDLLMAHEHELRTKQESEERLERIWAGVSFVIACILCVIVAIV